MRLAGLIGAAFAIAGAASLALAADDAVLAECRSASPEASLAACTLIVDSDGEATDTIVDAYVARAVALVRMGDLESAAADYGEAIRLDPGRAPAYLGRADVNLARGALDDAVADYSEVLRLGPQFAHAALLGRGEAHHAKRDFQRAIADFDAAIAADPAKPDCYRYRGDTHRAAGDLDRAIADYSGAIERGDRNADTFRRRGNALADKDAFDAAFADFESALALAPDDVTVLSTRGFTRFRQGDTDGAIADYTAAIRIDPKDVWSYRLRGIARLALGDIGHAEADFRQAAILQPSNAYIALWFEVAARRNGIAGRLEEAVAEIDRTVWPGPIFDYYRGHLSREALFAAAGDAGLQDVAGQTCEASFFAGELALIEGDRDEARSFLQQARETCPSNYVEHTAAGAELDALAAAP